MREILVHLNVQIPPDDDDQATPNEIGEAVVAAIRNSTPRVTFAEYVEVVLAEEL